MKGLLTKSQCETIIDIAKRGQVKANVGDKLSGTDLNAIFEMKVDPSSLKLLLDTRELIRDLVANHFNHGENLCSEFTHITSRKKSQTDYSHGIHADNCELRSDGQCIPSPNSCCAWRSHSSILFLNDEPEFNGAEFLFDDRDDQCLIEQGEIEGVKIRTEGKRTIITPQCGLFVAFSSGGENPHGVARVVDGMRWALATWLTLNCSTHAETVSQPSSDKYNVRWP